METRAKDTVRRLLPIPGLDDADEQALAMIVALTSEITVLRARLDTMERLIEAAGLVMRADIDAFCPDAAAEAERADLRGRTMRRVFRSLREGGTAAKADAA